MNENPYEVLDVAPFASAAEIRSAFHRAVRRLHPDRNPAADAAKNFQIACDAYEVLRDPGRRADLDARLRAGVCHMHVSSGGTDGDRPSGRRGDREPPSSDRDPPTTAGGADDQRVDEAADGLGAGGRTPADPLAASGRGGDDQSVLDEAVAYFERHFNWAGRPPASAPRCGPADRVLRSLKRVRPAHAGIVAGIAIAAAFVVVANSLTWILLVGFAAVAGLAWTVRKVISS